MNDLSSQDLDYLIIGLYRVINPMNKENISKLIKKIRKWELKGKREDTTLEKSSKPLIA